MKIVVLDGYGLNPGDLSWNGMEALGELTVYDRTAPDELMERSSGAEVLITNKTVITAENMAALPALKYIGVLATGYNIVDVAAAKERGIIVTNIPAYSTASVAQMVFAHLLNITQRIIGSLSLTITAFRSPGFESGKQEHATSRPTRFTHTSYTASE